MKRNCENSLKYSEFLKNNGKINLNFDKEWVIKLNDFPYNLENDIFHYVLWFNSPEERNIDIIEKIINIYFDKLSIWSINLIENRSNVRFFHVHIFTKVNLKI